MTVHCGCKRAGTIEISFALTAELIWTDARHHQRRQRQAAEIEPGLADWDCGDYEGKRSVIGMSS
jgi:hypothetical protein